ncbi:hypothetical protein Golob_004039 [Gossypium lobatum]|uniref:Uncharacterized protein n=1 Tax=Gossypium lobatum TaxID=34289 RepID=A0A7J8N049_9ROSI|nr:hypothetical protein [Gossypium lobatum]
MGDATPIEGFNDSNKHDTENEDIHNLEVAINPSPKTSNRGKRVLGIVQDKDKKIKTELEDQ